HPAGSFQVGCDHGGAGSQAGLHRRVAPQPPFHGLLGQQPRGHHHLGVAGVGATRDRRNRYRAMAQLHAIPVQLHVDHFRSRGSCCARAYAAASCTCDSDRPVRRRYASVSASMGNSAAVAPYSGDMLAMVARSGSASASRLGPKNSTNFPTTPTLRSICVTVSTRSVAVTPSGHLPVRRNPTTSGPVQYSGWPSHTASASMPPTPHPSTPRPLIMVVWESVPTSVSG